MALASTLLLALCTNWPQSNVTMTTSPPPWKWSKLLMFFSFILVGLQVGKLAQMAINLFHGSFSFRYYFWYRTFLYLRSLEFYTYELFETKHNIIQTYYKIMFDWRKFESYLEYLKAADTVS